MTGIKLNTSWIRQYLPIQFLILSLLALPTAALVKTERTDPPGSAGTITLSFNHCNSGLVEYDITSIGQQGSIPIKRVADDNAVVCEALAGQ